MLVSGAPHGGVGVIITPEATAQFSKEIEVGDSGASLVHTQGAMQTHVE